MSYTELGCIVLLIAAIAGVGWIWLEWSER